jgi:cytochrome c-type biogenesis protein CcmH
VSIPALIFALAVATTTPLDPAQEARAQSLEMEIRCVQCQNEPIAQSTADIAGDMRALVRERIAAGDTDTEIRAFFRERYGDYVLFRPPFDARTWLLWMAPFVLLACGLVALLAVRRSAKAGGQTFEPEEGER